MKETQKEKFRIGTLAKQLGVQRFVIRFWEKEFGISASRTKGGQRFYKRTDFEQFQHIKKLLYEEGFTIAGAKKLLEQNTCNEEPIATQELQQSLETCAQLKEYLRQLRGHLILLKELL